MKRFVLVTLTFIPVFVVVVFVDGFIRIEYSLRRTGHAKESLVASLRPRFPHLQCSGGNGYMPGLSITVVEGIEPEEQLRILDFLRVEKEKILHDVRSRLEFRDVSDPETRQEKSYEF
jgi:hypothetical protein